MLRIEIVNDGTMNTPENTVYPPNQEPFVLIGNYDYRVFINDKLIDCGKVKRHNRLTGWQGLLSCLDDEVNGGEWRE